MRNDAPANGDLNPYIFPANAQIIDGTHNGKPLQASKHFKLEYLKRALYSTREKHYQAGAIWVGNIENIPSFYWTLLDYPFEGEAVAVYPKGIPPFQIGPFRSEPVIADPDEELKKALKRLKETPPEIMVPEPVRAQINYGFECPSCTSLVMNQIDFKASSPLFFWLDNRENEAFKCEGCLKTFQVVSFKVREL